MIRNRRTPAGAALGREIARLVDEAEPRARLVEPAIPPRCASCAFRAGPHVANGSPQTLMDAMACVFDQTLFECHEPARAGQPCSGWAILQRAEAEQRASSDLELMRDERCSLQKASAGCNSGRPGVPAIGCQESASDAVGLTTLGPHQAPFTRPRVPLAKNLHERGLEPEPGGNQASADRQPPEDAFPHRITSRRNERSTSRPVAGHQQPRSTIMHQVDAARAGETRG